MAGEKRGIAFEALLATALKDCLGSKSKKKVFWNLKPQRMSINPDFTVGVTVDDPEALFLVSYPEAYLNSGFKFWRNVAETWEAKVLLSSPARVIGVQFGDGMKTDLTAVSKYVFDTLVHISTENGYKHLITCVEEAAPNLPSDREEKEKIIRRVILRSSQTKTEYEHFKKEIHDSLSRKNAVAASIWKAAALYYADQQKRSRVARTTSVRRAFAKLMLADNPLDAIASVKTGVALKNPGPFEFLGFGRNTLAGFRVEDKEIELLATQCDRGIVANVLNTLHADRRLQVLCAPLKNTDAVRAVASKVVTEWDSFKEPMFLYSEMKRCSLNSLLYARCLGANNISYVRPGLVAEMLLEGIREVHGKNQAFGNKALITGLALQPKMPRLRAEIQKTGEILGLPQTKWRAATTVSYGFRDWVFGDERQNFTLTDFELLRVAWVISEQLPKRPRKDGDVLTESIMERWAHNQFNNKIASYREFRPLDILVEAVLRKLGVKWQEILYFPSVWREVALQHGEQLNRRSATSSVYLAGKTLIRTQSVTESGASHKKKELCARAAGLRHTVDSSTLSVRNLKTVLIVDGCFSSGDLKMLSAAGWDEIFYPDEMDKFATAIV